MLPLSLFRASSCCCRPKITDFCSAMNHPPRVEKVPSYRTCWLQQRSGQRVKSAMPVELLRFMCLYRSLRAPPTELSLMQQFYPSMRKVCVRECACTRRKRDKNNASSSSAHPTSKPHVRSFVRTYERTFVGSFVWTQMDVKYTYVE